MFSSEMFPPLCNAPAVHLRQAEDAFEKPGYSNLQYIRLFSFFSLHQKRHLILGVVIFLRNKINIHFRFVFSHQVIFSCVLMVSLVPSTVSDNYTAG